LLSIKVDPVGAAAVIVLAVAVVSAVVSVVNEVEVLPKVRVGSVVKSMTLGTEKSAFVSVMPSVANLLD
jgi:hypothetical protein